LGRTVGQVCFTGYGLEGVVDRVDATASLSANNAKPKDANNFLYIDNVKLTKKVVDAKKESGRGI